MSVKSINQQAHFLISLSPIRPELYVQRMEEYKRLINLIDASELKIDQDVEIQKAMMDRKELTEFTKKKLDVI